MAVFVIHLQEHQGRTGLGGSDGGEVGTRVGVDGTVKRRGPEGGQLDGVGAVERDIGNGEHQSSLVVIGRTGQPISVRYSDSGTPTSPAETRVLERHSATLPS